MPNIENIMTDSIVTCTAQDNIYEAAVKMKQHDTGFIPIVDGERLIGVLTDRDLVIRAMAEKHPGSTSVRDVMTEEVISVGPEATIDEDGGIDGRPPSSASAGCARRQAGRHRIAWGSCRTRAFRG